MGFSEAVAVRAERFWLERNDLGSVAGVVVAKRAARRRVHAMEGLETAVRLLKRQDDRFALGHAKGLLETFIEEGELEGWFEPR